MYKQMEPKKNESGITLIALLVMIVILIILTAVVLRTITGDEPLIGTATNTAEDYKVESYREEISHTVHSEIISKSAVGETATTGDIAETLNEQEWVKIAIVNPEATAEVGNITVQVVEGYIYQVYYNSIYGKIEIDYIGKDIDPDDLNSFTLIARYEKSPASIYATAEDTKHGIAKLELIYKDELKQTKNNPSGEQKFDISEIGTGWYKVKATSKSGAIKYEWVKATNITDRLTTPEIRIETESTPKNGWYGADQKEVWIKISTNSPSAKSMHYTLSGAHTQAEKVETLPDTEEKSIRFQITETGITNVVAWTQDETDKYQSEEAKDSIKYDNKAPEITSIEEKGTAGKNSWYISDIELKINAEDLNGKPKTEENTGLENLNGYNYALLNEEGTELKSKTHITQIDTPIKTAEIAPKDGIYVLHITAEDKAGNESPTKVVTLQKDTKPPTIGNPQVTNITETGFQLTISAGDTTSGVAYYEYYINDTKVETLTEGIWIPTGLEPNSINNVKIIVYDNAGNKTESINTPVTTKGELKAPDIQITGNTRNGYYIGDVTIQVTDTSESTKTRVSKIKVTGAGAERTITGTSGSFTITADGRYTISAWSEDAQGNKSDTTTKPSFTRDATAPSTASLTVGTATETTIPVTASGADATSGVASYKFEYKLSTASTWSTADTKTSTSITYTYTGLLDGKTYNLRVTVTDKAGNSYTGSSVNGTTVSKVILSPTEDIGKYVNYQPTRGSYTVSSTYSGSDQSSFSTETSLKWRIWNVDTSNLYLVSNRATYDLLYLYGAIGYNNGVTLLDNICNSCYKNSSYSGITARNLKIEDITPITKVSNFNTRYGTQPYTYNFAAPYIWTTYEESSKTNAINNRSTAYSLTTSETSSSTRISPYSTLWQGYDLDETTAYKNEKYKELVVDAVSYDRDYWLSSRYVNTASDDKCTFGLHRASMSSVGDFIYLFAYENGFTKSYRERMCDSTTNNNPSKFLHTQNK